MNLEDVYGKPTEMEMIEEEAVMFHLKSQVPPPPNDSNGCQ
jgi:hypothetical protein